MAIIRRTRVARVVRTFLVVVLAVSVVLTIVFASSDAVRSHVYFGLLQATWRLERKGDTRPKTEWLVARLADSPAGLYLAAQDCSLFGGTTGAASSQILLESRLDELVIAELDRVVVAPGIPLSQKLEALCILWERTHKPEYVRLLLASVSGPVPKSLYPESAVVAEGRVRLAQMLPHGEESRVIGVPADQPIPISEDEINRMMEK